MVRRYANFFKNCATCVYWMGVRSTDYAGLFVEVPDENAKGRCMAPIGKGWRGQDRRLDGYCTCYKKWDVLR